MNATIARAGAAHLVHAEGAPCPTLVVDADRLPPGDEALLEGLARVRDGLGAETRRTVLKNAVVRPSAHPLFDLDYYFVQSLPGGRDRFDTRGSCGHSILAAVEAAARDGMIEPLEPGRRVRVNVLNNGDHVVCETDETGSGRTRFTAHFLCTPARPVGDLLITGEAVTRVTVDGRQLPVSLVDMGNPYVFVGAGDLGVRDAQELFAAGDELFGLLGRVRRAVCAHMGWDASGAFPKIAALLPGPDGDLAVRAVSVPSWHPTLALTGAICLGTAVGIEGTLPWSLARAAGHDSGLVRLRTPGGPLRVRARITGPADTPRLGWVSVADKYVRYENAVHLTAGARSAALTPDRSRSEDPSCLSLPL
ncbi:PrpF domain-containing protein [Streptomyces sp. NPDC006193]|uniref:PrpF domain-containing protein n=1 Tax=Streptomyces sp. NPDC006193 TaxID=3155717 RepID=UPI0033AB4845